MAKVPTEGLVAKPSGGYFGAMALLLHEPGFTRRILPLSVAAWHRLGEAGLAPAKAELLRGAVVGKVPKSILQIQLIGRLYLMLQALIGQAFWVRQEASMTLADSEPEPDISVVLGRDTDYRSHPTTAKLVVEVSISSLAEDRELAGIYAETGVEEYWIVNAAARAVEIYRNPSGGRYQTVVSCQVQEIAECVSLPGVRVSVAELFAGIG